MAISYVGGKGSGTAGQGGGAIDLTTGLTGGSGGAPIAGDLVLVTVSVGTAGRQPSINITTPTGYTALTAQRTTATTYDTNIQTCWKFMGSTPDTSVTIPPSGNVADGISYTIRVYRGVNPTGFPQVTPAYSTGSGVDNLPDPASITPTVTGSWIVICGGGAAATASTLVASYLTAFQTFNGADTNDGNIGCGHYTGWTSGAYDGAKFTGGSVNSANSWGCTVLVLEPVTSATYNESFTLTAAGSILSTGVLTLNETLSLVADTLIETLGGIIVDEIIFLSANGNISAVYSVEFNESLELIAASDLGILVEGVFETSIVLNSDGTISSVGGREFTEILTLLAEASVAINAGLDFNEVIELVVGGFIPGDSGGTIFLRRR